MGGLGRFVRISASVRTLQLTLHVKMLMRASAHSLQVWQTRNSWKKFAHLPSPRTHGSALLRLPLDSSRLTHEPDSHAVHISLSFDYPLGLPCSPNLEVKPSFDRMFAITQVLAQSHDETLSLCRSAKFHVHCEHIMRLCDPCK